MIRGKPDVSAFLDGGADGDVTPQKKKIVDKEKARQKIVTLPSKMLIDLKRCAIDESEQGGARITENDIVRRALETYLYK